MALLMYLNKERFRPENPLVFDTHLNDDVFMSFVDLIPSVIKRSTTAAMTAGEVEYHSFREIMDLANSWLERNPNWTVFNCETVMLYYKFNDKMSYYELRPNDSNFYIYGSEKNNVLKALRIWVKRKRGRDKQYIDVQTLNYYDIIPEQLNEYGKYENLDHIIEKANELISNKDIQGNLITIESLICEYSKTKVEPDITLNVTSTKKMMVLRIFYQENSLTIDSSLGIIDFVPGHLSGGGLFKRPKYEPFDDVLSRAYVWLSENTSVRLVNLKTLDIKLKSWTNIDTKIMHYNEHGCYLRILRLAYARKSGQRAPMLALSSKSLSNDTIITNKNLLFDKNKKKLKSVTFQNSKNKKITTENKINHNLNKSNQDNVNKNTEHCYIHNEQLKNAVDNALKAIEEAKELESKIVHPDEETILANEEEFHKQMLQHKKLAEHANSKCTCNVDAISDESFESVNDTMNLKNNEEIKNEKKFVKSKKIYLNSKFFNPIRKNETIQKMQIRIHEFVNSMLTVKNLNNNQTTFVSGKRNSKRYSIVDGSLVALPKMPNSNENKRKKVNSKKGGFNDNYLSSNNNVIEEHNNDVLSSKSINESRKTSFVQNNMQGLLIDQDVHCNVICAETINIFCKSIETNLYEEQNETFQYNRFGTRNGYIIVTFRIYYDNGSNNHILEYQNKMNEQKKTKTLKLSIENNKNGISTKIKQELVNNPNLNEQSNTKKLNNRNPNESMCCII